MGNKGGRPPIQYDPELAEKVHSMAQVGSPLEDIAELCSISVPTLRKLYKKELKAGTAYANMQVGKCLFQKCMQGDTTAMIFWAKTRMGWREKDRNADVKNNELDQLAQAIKQAFGSVG